MQWDLVVASLTGLILFLYGIEHFSREILRTAGDRFRQALSRLTKNRFGGALLGAVVTALVQSSTATTVIAVGLVNAGALSFARSLPVIIGANVGTTVTAQLVAFKLTAFAPLLIIAGFLISVVGGRFRFIGKSIFYFGLVFFGLDLVSQAIIPLNADPRILELFSSLSNVFVSLLVGLLFTIVFQSSSVTSGIVVVLAQQGLLTLPQAIPLLLGANIGTTVTSLIASWSMELYARRAAMAHLLFNLIGAFALLPFVSPFALFIISIGGTAGQQVANAHTVFNIGAAIVFLIGLRALRWAVERIVPGKQEELLFRTKYLTDPLPERTSTAFGMVEKEIAWSLELTRRLYDESMLMLHHSDTKVLRRVEKLEAISDYLDERIEEAILEISHRRLTKASAEKTVLLVRISNAVEQLGDLGKDIGELSLKLVQKGETMSPDAEVAIKDIYKAFSQMLAKIKFPKPPSHRALSSANRRIKRLITIHFKRHVTRLKKQQAYAGSAFVESISLMEASVAKLEEIAELSQKYARVK